MNYYKNKKQKKITTQPNQNNKTSKLNNLQISLEKSETSSRTLVQTKFSMKRK